MPIYEFECLECGDRFELRQSIDQLPPATCPAGHKPVRRLLSAPAIIFKGSGFYVTDHGRNGNCAASRPQGADGSRARARKQPSPKAPPDSKPEATPGDCAG